MNALSLALAAAGVIPAPASAPARVVVLVDGKPMSEAIKAGAKVVEVAPMCALNGREIEAWETLTLEEAGLIESDFWTFCGRGGHPMCAEDPTGEWEDEKYYLADSVRESPEYKAAVEAERQVRVALEATIAALGLADGNHERERCRLIREFRPMLYPPVWRE